MRVCLPQILFCPRAPLLIGYGDYSPRSVAGRIIACAYLLGATVIIAVFFDKLGSYMVDARLEKRRKQVRRGFVDFDDEMLQQVVRACEADFLTCMLNALVCCLVLASLAGS